MEWKRWKVSYGCGDNGGSENNVVDEDGEGVFRSIYSDDVAEQLVKDHNAVIELGLALEGITKYYVDMINRGDCGFWNPEEDACVIAARAALANIKGQP